MTAEHVIPLLPLSASATHMLQFLQTEFKVKNYLLVRMDKDFLEKYFQFLRTARKIF
jgi:hypothetical protein